MSLLFWVLAALLTAAALYSLLRPMIRLSEQSDTARENSLVAIYSERLLQIEQQHQRGELDADQLTAARAELEASLALELPEQGNRAKGSSAATNRKVVPALVGVTVPLLAVFLYLVLGMPQAIDGTPDQGNANTPMLSIDEMVMRLEQRLQTNPDDTQGWIMLGRSYAALNQLEKARDAYLEVVKRAPANAEVLFNLAEVTAALQNQSLAGEAETYLNLGLQLDPQSRRGRWLQGILAYQQDNPERAVELWEQLLAEGDNAQEKELLKRFIQQAKGSTPDGVVAETPAVAASSESAAPATTSSEAEGPQVTVDVRLANDLASRVSNTDTLFVYAKAASGPPMPLAIVRKTAGELPLQVTLDDTQAMMAQMKLSSFDQVIINARISKTGNATTSPGDLQGVSKPVNPAQNPAVNIVIDSVVP